MRMKSYVSILQYMYNCATLYGHKIKTKILGIFQWQLFCSKKYWTILLKRGPVVCLFSNGFSRHKTFGENNPKLRTSYESSFDWIHLTFNSFELLLLFFFFFLVSPSHCSHKCWRDQFQGRVYALTHVQTDSHTYIKLISSQKFFFWVAAQWEWLSLWLLR